MDVNELLLRDFQDDIDFFEEVSEVQLVQSIIGNLFFCINLKKIIDCKY